MTEKKDDDLIVSILTVLLAILIPSLIFNWLEGVVLTTDYLSLLNWFALLFGLRMLVKVTLR